MKVQDLINNFTVDPFKDIIPYFSLVKKLDVDYTNHKECLNCGNCCNNRSVQSVSWTHIQYCWKCESINVIYVTDRMGGGCLDTVECYKEAIEGDFKVINLENKETTVVRDLLILPKGNYKLTSNRKKALDRLVDIKPAMNIYPLSVFTFGKQGINITI